MKNLKLILMGAGLVLLPAFAHAYVSGSTGADGAFAPTANTQVVLPPNGVLNYTTVNIPANVVVTFKKNASNTPVVILASGDVTIAGGIDVRGQDGAAVGSAGDGILTDDGKPGAGGPGGYDGGPGGPGTISDVVSTNGGNGLGPGGGTGGQYIHNGTYNTTINYSGGSGGGFGTGGGITARPNGYYSYLAGGPAYGSGQLLPLIGGSGGGGGKGDIYNGSGGGGGGGAILIASSGTVNISGWINADGGAGGAVAGAGGGGSGGGGSGGGIRIVASTITGDGVISAMGQPAGADATSVWYTGGVGGAGRIRLEAEIYSRTAVSTPVHNQGLPGPVFLSGLPTLSISSVGGAAVPAQPTGNADVTLPATTVNPVTVVFTTTGVPAGNTVALTLTPPSGATLVKATSTPLVGDTTSATASASITLPDGPCTLQATLTYNIVLALGNALSVYAQGERVEKISLASTLGSKESMVTLITVSGKRFVVPAAVLATMPS